MLDGTGLYDSNVKLPLSPSRDVYVITHLRINLQRNPQRVLKTDCYSVVLSWCEKKILPSLILSQQQLILLVCYYKDMNEHRGFSALQCSCSLSSVCTHGTSRLGADTSLLTCPCVSTMIRSQPRTVCRRWAIVSIVQSANASLMVSWISKSVSVSIAAVASSRISIWKQHRILVVTHGHTFPPSI